MAAVDFSDFQHPHVSDMTEQQFLGTLQRVDASGDQTSGWMELYQSAEYEAANDEFRSLLRRRRARQLESIRNQASDAYYTHALYLSYEVDQAAVAVRDAFHGIVGPYYSGDRINLREEKLLLRSAMLALQNKAKFDLSRGERTGDQNA